MRGKILGVLDGTVMATSDGVFHHGVYIAWDRNDAKTAFHALCDFSATFPSYIMGTINMEELRKAGVRYTERGHLGKATCMECIVTMNDDWKPVEVLRRVWMSRIYTSSDGTRRLFTTGGVVHHVKMETWVTDDTKFTERGRSLCDLKIRRVSGNWVPLDTPITCLGCLASVT